MTGYVPEFEMDPSTSRVRSAGEPRNALGGERSMELLLQNGEMVTQTIGDSGCGGGFGEIPCLHAAPAAHASEEVLDDDETEWWPQGQQVVTQDDEMSTWLQFPMDDLEGNFYSELLYSSPTVPHRSGVSINEFFQPRIRMPPPSTSFVPYRSPIEPLQPIHHQADNWALSGWNMGGTLGASTSDAGKDIATVCEPTGKSTASGSVKGTKAPVYKRMRRERLEKEKLTRIIVKVMTKRT